LRCRKGVATPVDTAARERPRSLVSIKASREGLVKVDTKRRPPNARARKLRTATRPVFMWEGAFIYKKVADII
jgi:hypothetical protein